MTETRSSAAFVLTFVAFCAALNAGVGFLVQVFKLPIYLDLIGSVLAAVLIGPLYGVIAAVIGIMILGLVTTPTAFAYVGTAVVVTLCAYAFSRWGYLRKWPATIGYGLALGLISAILSAPVTTYLFGGISFVGADAFTAFFRATGETVAKSVLLGGLATDPVDKILMSVICHLLVAGLPQRLKARFTQGHAQG